MFNRFAICQAYMQLESDYNVDGILRERPSNQRRNESIGVQLLRIGYSSPFQCVDITAESDDCDDPDDEIVREIYMCAALRWNLPMDQELKDAIRATFVPEFLAQFPQMQGD